MSGLIQCFRKIERSNHSINLPLSAAKAILYVAQFENPKVVVFLRSYKILARSKTTSLGSQCIARHLFTVTLRQMK